MSLAGPRLQGLKECGTFLINAAFKDRRRQDILSKAQGCSVEEGKDPVMEMEGRRPEQRPRTPGTPNLPQLLAGFLLRRTKGGEDTKKLSWRQQDVEDIPVTCLSFLLVMEEGESLGAAQGCRDSETTPWVWDRQQGRTQRLSGQAGVQLLRADCYLDALEPRSRCWEWTMQRTGVCYKWQKQPSPQHRHETTEFRFSLQTPKLGKAVQREPLSKHLMNLLQKEKNLFSHLYFQTHIIKWHFPT